MEASKDEPHNIIGLVDEIQAGSASAETKLISLFSRSVRLTLLSQADFEDVDDLEQEVFRLTLQKIRENQLREAKKLPGFIIQLTKNLVVDHYRREKRLKQKAEIYGMRRVSPSTKNPLEEMICREQASAIRQMINGLGEERDRELLRRYYILEEDREVVCRELGLTREQFSRVLYRAKERFKRVFLQRSGRKTKDS